MFVLPHCVRLQLFAIILQFSISSGQTNKTSTKSCVISSYSSPVTFSSLAEYQGSKNSFNPEHPTYKSNIVNFSFISIDNIPRNSFISFNSDSIIKIILNEKGITAIADGAFNQLFCLHILELRQNNISILTDNVFEGLPNLEVLDLSENLLEHIGEGSLPFRLLSRLQRLNLSQNRIRDIGTFAFMNLTRLQVLDLGRNKLRKISPEVFSYLKALKELYLNNNFLYEIQPEKLMGLNTLESLDLAGNSLNTFDPSYNFSFFGLKKLNLSDNYLTSLNAFTLRKQFTSLKLIDIRKNNWMCETLDVIKRALADSEISLADNVECVETTGSYRQPTTERTTVSTTPAGLLTVGSVKPNTRDYSKDLFEQNKSILRNNGLMLNSIQHLENLVVYLFIIIVIFVVVDVAVRFGICGNLYYRLSGRVPRYLDAGNVENMALINSR